MKWALKTLPLVAVVVLLFSAVPLANAESYVVPADAKFPFGGAPSAPHISFTAQQTFSTPPIVVSDYNATWKGWAFFDGYGFYSASVNVTVSTFFVGQILTFTTRGAGDVKVYTPSLGQPVTVTGDNTNTYGAGVTTVTLVNTAATVTLDWNPANSNGAQSGGSTPPDTSSGDDDTQYFPTPTPTALNPQNENVTPPSSNGIGNSDLAVAGMAAAVFVLVIAAVSKHERKPNIRRIRRDLKRQSNRERKRPKIKKKNSYFD